MEKKPFISCVYLVNEFEWNDYIPWQISLENAIEFADEVIVVKGQYAHCSQGESVENFLNRIQSDKIKVVHYTWSENFNWLEIANALNAGVKAAQGEWVFRILMDEIIPPEFYQVFRRGLKNMSRKIDVVRVGRFFSLNNEYLYPYILRALFFRNNGNYLYGREPLSNTDKLLFDDPIYIENEDFEIPTGHRNFKYGTLNGFIVNTHLTYYPDELIEKKNAFSFDGYKYLPKEYKEFVQWSNKDPKDLADDYFVKVQGMIKNKKYFKYRCDFLEPYSVEKNRTLLDMYDKIENIPTLKNFYNRHSVFLKSKIRSMIDRT